MNEDKLERLKDMIAATLGPIEALPMLFDGNSLCPQCLWHAMNIMGNRWICDHCGFTIGHK